jgi:hypothetical protein
MGLPGYPSVRCSRATAFSDANVDDSHHASQWLVELQAAANVILDTGTDTDNLTTLRVTGLQPSTTYEWQVRYQDDLGGWSQYSNPTQFTVAAASELGSV